MIDALLAISVFAKRIHVALALLTHEICVITFALTAIVDVTISFSIVLALHAFVFLAFVTLVFGLFVGIFLADTLVLVIVKDCGLFFLALAAVLLVTSTWTVVVLLHVFRALLAIVITITVGSNLAHALVLAAAPHFVVVYALAAVFYVSNSGVFCRILGMFGAFFARSVAIAVSTLLAQTLVLVLIVFFQLGSAFARVVVILGTRWANGHADALAAHAFVNVRTGDALHFGETSPAHVSVTDTAITEVAEIGNGDERDVDGETVNVIDGISFRRQENANRRICCGVDWDGDARRVGGAGVIEEARNIGRLVEIPLSKVGVKACSAGEHAYKAGGMRDLPFFDVWVAVSAVGKDAVKVRDVLDIPVFRRVSGPRTVAEKENCGLQLDLVVGNKFILSLGRTHEESQSKEIGVKLHD